MTVTSNFLLLLIFANLKVNFCIPGVIYKEILPPVEDNFTMTSHLEYKHIKKICSSRYSICKSNDTNVCGMRYFQNNTQYEDFDNSCFMFMRNMCDNPGEEYHITSSGTCKDFLRNRINQKKARRDQDDEEVDEGLTPNIGEEETNAEQGTETSLEQTEQDDENYTDNPEQTNTEPGYKDDDVEQDETNADNEETENTEAQDAENETENPNTQHQIAAELNEEENDETTQSVNAYIETVGDSGSDTTTLLSRIKHSKAALRRVVTKGNLRTKSGKTPKKPTRPNNNPTKPTKKATAKANSNKNSTPPNQKSRTNTSNAKSSKNGIAKKTSPIKTNTVSSKSTKNTATKKVPNTTRFTLYPVEQAFDDDICPISCPTIYSPVCVSANRGNGLHFKFFTFINHCYGDVYYCKHPEEFKPPPDEEEENVNFSPLSWSYCAASRYIQFARFAEVASSMGHYGWLAGDYRPTHIMEPHERMRGYG